MVVESGPDSNYETGLSERGGNDVVGLICRSNIRNIMDYHLQKAVPPSMNHVQSKSRVVPNFNCLSKSCEMKLI